MPAGIPKCLGFGGVSFIFPDETPDLTPKWPGNSRAPSLTRFQRWKKANPLVLLCWTDLLTMFLAGQNWLTAKLGFSGFLEIKKERKSPVIPESGVDLKSFCHCAKSKKGLSHRVFQSFFKEKNKRKSQRPQDREGPKMFLALYESQVTIAQGFFFSSFFKSEKKTESLVEL